MYNERHLNLLRELIVSQHKLKDQSTFLGLVWSFLNPLLLLLILFLFFSMGLGRDIDHYAIYLLIGLIQYTHFSNATSTALKALRSARELTAEAVFPKELLVLSTVASLSIEFVVSMLIALGIAIVTGVEPRLSWAWIPVAVTVQLLLVVWVSLALASLYPFARDIDHVYQVFLRIMFFATPIFYDVELIGDGIARGLVSLNPLAYVIEVSRNAVLEGANPSISALAAFSAVNAALLLLSVVLFRRLEPEFAENV